MSDLMAWNADATRMPARMHGQYLRQLFLHNDLAANRYRVDGRPVMLRDLRLPLFCVGTENDHVAPWRSVFKLHGLTPAPLDFVLTSGGHNAGIVSEPGHPRRRYRSLARPAGGPTLTPDEWLQAAPAHDVHGGRPGRAGSPAFPASPQAARPGRAAPKAIRAGGRARRLCPGERGMTPDLPARPASARVLRALGAALLPLLAGGCLSMAPDYQRPAAPVPTTYEQAPTADAETPAAATVNWRDYYTDPILQDLIDSALRNNRDLRTALLRVERARSMASSAPTSSTIGVQADGSRARAGRPEPDAPAADQQPVPGRRRHGELGAGFLGPRAQPEGRRAAKLPGLRRRRQNRHAQPDHAGGRRLPDAARAGRTPGADARDHCLARRIAAHLQAPLRGRRDLAAGPDPGGNAVAAGHGAGRGPGTEPRCAGPRAGAAGGRPAGAASGRRAAGRRRRHARPAGGTAVRPAGQPSRHRRGRAPSKSRQRQHRRRPRRLFLRPSR